MTQVITTSRQLPDGIYPAVVEDIELQDGDSDTGKNPNGNHKWRVTFVVTPEDGLGDVTIYKTMAFYSGAAFFAEKIVRGILGADFPRNRPMDDEIELDPCRGRRVMVRVDQFHNNRTDQDQNNIAEVLPIPVERRAARRGMLEAQS